MSVTAEGQVYFEKEPIAGADVEATLRRANQEDASRRLIMRADRTTPYAQVRKLFKACQGIGFPGVSMRVNAVNQDDK